MRNIEPSYRELTDVITIMELAYHELADAIILQAVDDYRKALDGKSYSEDSKKSPEWVKRECEKFFRSSWYRSLTKVDGEFLIGQLIREHNEKVRKENNYAR